MLKSGCVKGCDYQKSFNVEYCSPQICLSHNITHELAASYIATLGYSEKEVISTQFIHVMKLQCPLS